MKTHALAVPDSFLLTATKLPDERGFFSESLRQKDFTEQTGHVFPIGQVNVSLSHRGVLRGIHAVALPPGQAKMVTCHRGVILDVVVDLRVGSPTFGVWDTNVLEGGSGDSVYVAEGLGHGFVSLSDDSLVGYLCSTEHVPGTQIDVAPFDPELGIDWGIGADAMVSAKDAAAPGVTQLCAVGRLATYQECLDYYAALRAS